MSVSEARNCTIWSVSVPRIFVAQVLQFLDQEIVIFGLFLVPEIATYGHFLGPENSKSQEQDKEISASMVAKSTTETEAKIKARMT